MAGDPKFSSCVLWALGLSLVFWGLIAGLGWLISKFI